MIARLSAISFNTFREAVRDRVLYNLVLFALLLVAAAPLFGEISIGLEKLNRLDEALAQYESYLKILPSGAEAGEAKRAIERLKTPAASAKSN